MFDEMIETISDEVTLGLIRAQVRMKTPEEIEEEKRRIEEARKARLGETEETTKKEDSVNQDKE